MKRPNTTHTATVVPTAERADNPYLTTRIRFIQEILKTPSFGTLTVFASANLLTSVLGGFGGLLQARWIAPEVFGEFRQFGIMTSYLNIGLILVHDGLSRQFPYLLGKGDTDGSMKVAAVAKWWYLLLSWTFSILFAGLALTSLQKNNYRSAVGWGTQIGNTWAAIYGAYLGVMYRTSSDFKRLSGNSVLSTVVGFVALIFVQIWGFWGLAVRVVLQNAVGLKLARRHVPVKVNAVFDAKALANLATISLPLSVPGYISTSCLSASVSLIILKHCGQSGLGVYGVALAFQGLAMTFTSTVQQMSVTRLTCKYGSTNDVWACLKYAKIPTLLSLAAATTLAIGLSVLIDPFISFLLPKYQEAAPVIRILAIQIPIAAAALPLLILKAALCYRSVVVLSLTPFLVTLAAIAILPKTLELIAMCVVLGDFSALIVGYSMLRKYR